MHGQQNIKIQEEFCCLHCLVATECDAICRLTAHVLIITPIGVMIPKAV